MADFRETNVRNTKDALVHELGGSTSVLKQVIDVIVPFVVDLFNRSLSEGHFPAVFKEAFVTPVVMKPGLDATDTSSYRPISNLSVLSKLLEHLVDSQLMKYLTSAYLLPLLQSGFRPGHSTGPYQPVSAKTLTAGFSHTCLAAASTFAADLLGRLLRIWCAAYRRDPC